MSWMLRYVLVPGTHQMESLGGVNAGVGKGPRGWREGGARAERGLFGWGREGVSEWGFFFGRVGVGGGE